MNKINFQNLPSTSTPLNATNLNQMQDNMDDVDVLRAGKTEIPANSDLDTFTTPGTYKVASAANAANLTHSPVTNHAFKMITERIHLDNNTRLRQTIYNNDNDLATYYRYYNGSSWGDWLLIPGMITETNANGTAIKFSDGTMICTKQVTATDVAFSASGNIYTSTNSVNLGNYAVSFDSAPILQVTCKGSYSGWVSQISAYGKNAIGSLYISKADSNTRTFIIDITAVGRWKA